MQNSRQSAKIRERAPKMSSGNTKIFINAETNKSISKTAKHHQPQVSISLASRTTQGQQKRSNLIKDSGLNSNHTFETNGSLNSKYRQLSNQAGLCFNEIPKASKHKQNILVSNGGTIQISKQNNQQNLEKKYATTAGEDMRRKTGSFNRQNNSS